MAIHAPITGASTRAPIFARFGLFNRAEIEQEIERLIAMLDDADGDYDLEDDDPAGDFLDRGEGEGDHGQGLLKVRPLYAVDQCAGPTNYTTAQRDHRAAEMGLVRTASGGWGWPR